MKVAIYCRTGNCDDTAIANQIHNLQQYAEDHNLQIVEKYCDCGLSGSKLDRPELKHLIKDFEAGKFEAVLVVNHSRLFRGSYFEKPDFPFKIIEAIPSRLQSDLFPIQ